MNKNNYCIIMAGGVGSRFWPLSRMNKPKQFIDILGTGRTLIQQTFDRMSYLCPKENIYIVTNSNYKQLTLEQLPEITKDQVLLEPLRRNTAPCIAYANHKIASRNPNANIIVAPSDHLILKEETFVQQLTKALKFTENNDGLLTLGIKPSRPETGYGYIQINKDLEIKDEKNLFQVKTFTEKPNLDMAKIFMESGEFYWNSGIFVWSMKTIMQAFELHLPEVNSLFKDGTGLYNTEKEQNFIDEIYPECKNISIDYGVMEKAENVYVLCTNFGWSDLGTWGSLYEHSEKDQNENALSGKNILTYETKNCIINSPKDKLVVTYGLDDYIIVDSDNILLICKKEDEQNIRQIVNDIKIEKGKDFV